MVYSKKKRSGKRVKISNKRKQKSKHMKRTMRVNKRSEVSKKSKKLRMKNRKHTRRSTRKQKGGYKQFGSNIGYTPSFKASFDSGKYGSLANPGHYEIVREFHV